MIAKALLQARQLELSLRPSYPREIATAILRYGAMVGAECEHLPEASRCMDLARAEIQICDREDRSFPSGRVILADQLTGGKGRFLRHWHAPAGGVWMVLTLANTLLPEHAALYPLAAGVACCETVRHFGLNATVKWVNDVLLGGRKVAGILTETVSSSRGGEEFVLIGIGLNVNNTSFAPELRNTAASMCEFSGHPFDLTEIAAMLIAKLSWNIGLLHYTEAEHLAADRGLDDDRPHPLIASWRLLTDTIGRRVRFGFNVVESAQYTATVVDVDPCGHLVMRLENGDLVTESGGEIMYL
ncbi:MAG: biotin--[acetyl-CoA-carboxylase] ligase [Proteobacteria bacterium]|nr:biotin--[acetyl-CoA-carboxylase] ligase [Desulfobulbaceae bacterium]MBU4152833.1 biotin--[acetyl-CoA-carboxylase] ligase [Pseudomonadota bacterium]